MELAERWGAEQLINTVGTPWRMREREEQSRRQIAIQPRRSVEVAAPRPKAEYLAPKRKSFRKHVSPAKYGPAYQCPGCGSALPGIRRTQGGMQKGKGWAQDDNEHNGETDAMRAKEEECVEGHDAE